MTFKARAHIVKKYIFFKKSPIHKSCVVFHADFISVNIIEIEQAEKSCGWTPLLQLMSNPAVPPCYIQHISQSGTLGGKEWFRLLV